MFYLHFIKCFSKITPLFNYFFENNIRSMINKKIDKQSNQNKCNNKYEMDVQRKKLSKRIKKISMEQDLFFVMLE